MGHIFDGKVNGQIELTDSHVILRRPGVLGFLTQGLKGEKRIPYASITSVQFKMPGMMNGYIQFGVAGGVESKGGIFAATQDENTVMFSSKARDAFLKLRDLVEERSELARRGATIGGGTRLDRYDELTRLADLKDRGVLTEEEFAQQKARLLDN